MTRVGASAGGPRGADQADELQRPCARTSGGDAAARRQGRGTEHSLLPLRPVSRQAHSQGRPGRLPRARPPSWGPRLRETQNRARTDLRGTRLSEPRSTKVARRPSRPPGSPARVTGPGARPAAAPLRAHSEPPCALKAEPASGRACLSFVPAAARPRGDALRALTLGPSSPLTSTHWRGHRPARGRALGLGGTTPRPRQARSAPRTLPGVPAARRALAVPVQNCLGRRPGLGSAVLFSLRTVTAKTLPVPFVRGAPGTSMPASTASVLPAAVPCR